MNPGQIACAFADMVQLSLLPSPENSQRQKTHPIGQPLWTHGAKSRKQFVLAAHTPLSECEDPAPAESSRENAVA